MNDEALSRIDTAMEKHKAMPASVSDRRPAELVLLGDRFDEALLYASTAHRQQARKDTPVPYMSHLLGVCSIVLSHGGNEDQALRRSCTTRSRTAALSTSR